MNKLVHLLKDSLRILGPVLVVLSCMGCSVSHHRSNLIYPPIQVYIREGCRHCAALEEALHEEQIPYQRLVVNRDQAAMRKFRQLGFVGVPTTVIRSEIIRGNYPRLIIQTAERYAYRVSTKRVAEVR